MSTRRTLLLTSSYEPVTFLTERRTLSLILRNKVDIVMSWEGYELLPERSEYGRVFLPSVIRLKQWYSRKSSTTHFHRRVLFERDNHQCQYCAKKLSTRERSIDHLVPKSRGGKSTWKNCVTACRQCNWDKGDRTPEEAEMNLLKPVAFPNLIHFWNSKLGSLHWCPHWDTFLPG